MLEKPSSGKWDNVVLECGCKVFKDGNRLWCKEHLIEIIESRKVVKR